MIFELLENICRELEVREIEYMISGSLAMTVYTRPRMTRDIDVVIQLNSSDIDSFLEIFQSNFYFHRPSIEEEVKRKGMFNVIDHDSGYKIDFIVRKNDIYRKTEFDRKQRGNLMGVQAWVVSLEDLIISKLIWIQDYQFGQQIEDINQLLENEKLDKKYLNYWCLQLQLNTFKLF